MTAPTRRLVVGITGASGALYGVRLLERARALGVETHLVATAAGVLNVHHELGLDRASLESRATRAYSPGDIGACIASGSFATSAMVVAPCSMKSLAAIAHAFGDNLLTRAADVALKERRRLVVMPRETPLSLIHLENMATLTRAGAIVMPAMPGFYNLPRSVDDLVDFMVAKALDHLGVPNRLMARWGEDHKVDPFSDHVALGGSGSSTGSAL